MMKSKTVAIIPARWQSVRFPGKPLVEIRGKPLIQHVWERCQEAKEIRRTIIATDDMRIAEAAFAFGAEVALTSPDHPSGTDRLAEVATSLKGVGIILNVQGDEPAIAPGLLDDLVRAMRSDRSLAMATAAVPFASSDAAADSNNVKVVTDAVGNALYFSRSRIPFDRAGASGVVPLHHLGIYAYRRKFLLRYVQWLPTPLETCEHLEQLRVLEMGEKIRVIETPHRSVGVDVPSDVALAEAELDALARDQSADA